MTHTRSKLLRFLLLVALFPIFVVSSAGAQTPVQEDGELEVIIADDITFTHSEMEYYLKKNGKRKKLHFRGAAPDGLVTGMRAKVRGFKKDDNALEVGTAAGDFEVSGGEILGVGGVRQALVLKIKSTTAESSATHAQLAATAAEMNNYFVEMSFGQLSVLNDLNGDGIKDVHTVQINASSSGVGEGSAFTFCNEAISKAPVDTNPYHHIVCILPPDMNYGWYGQAYIGGKTMVINGNYANGYADGLTHETGHNLGMHHANTPGTEYGERACIMGGAAGHGRRHANGPHKFQMAWLNASSAGAGTYRINAVEAQPGQRVSPDTLLKVRDTIGNRDLYISYRNVLGSYSSAMNLPERTSVHSWPGGATQTILLGTVGDGEAPLVINGISIAQISHDAVSAFVQIGADCVAAAPSVAISPSSVTNNSLSGASYNISVTNRDSNCSGTTTFNLAVQATGGASAQLGSSSMQLAGGQSGATSLSIVAGATGTYQATVTVTAANHAPGSATATYILDLSPPQAITNLSGAVAKRNKVNLSWSAPADAGSGVGSYLINRNGATITTVSGTSYSDSPGTGTFTYTVQARDRAGNVGAASNAVTVTVSSGGGGNGGKGPKGGK